MSKLTLIAASSILSNIEKVKTSGAELDTLIHTTAVQCMLHAKEHGDVTLAQRLMEAMPKASRALALKDWYHKFSPMRLEGKVGILKATQKGYNAFRVEEADAEPFWTEAEQPAKKPLTLAAMLKIAQGLPKRLEDAAAEDNFTGDIDKARLMVGAVAEAVAPYVAIAAAEERIAKATVAATVKATAKTNGAAKTNGKTPPENHATA